MRLEDGLDALAAKRQHLDARYRIDDQDGALLGERRKERGRERLRVGEPVLTHVGEARHLRVGRRGACLAADFLEAVVVEENDVDTCR